MANNRKSNIWAWVIIGLLTAALAVGVLFYIGWFDTNTHVDSENGDNVTEQYINTDARPDEPGEAEWQNTSEQSLRNVIADPEHPTATPPNP
ncbi:MAG: hypothetical protein K2P06_05830 [Muribaculaceae bacterium]|jgi:flagellar basal body-associated protein FliL|nr:hypothetical protein [Muribaculaceae bacterium]MDE7032866.1 hypothetical protein [Muribaculaceae bacterium]